MQPPVTVKTVLWKLLPLWILIAINVFVIIGLARGTDPHNSMSRFMTFFGGAALAIFDVIYLFVWIKTVPYEDDSSSTRRKYGGGLIVIHPSL
jgi:hypothetical protein